MRFLRYNVSKDDPPSYKVGLNRCYHGKLLGVYVKWKMRCYSWMWRLCK